jgi:hypothetical protein
MKTSMVDIPLHNHTCSGCGSNWKHYSASGCTVPDKTLCPSCVAVQSRPQRDVPTELVMQDPDVGMS